MKPLLLKGHERSITFVKYNREGDLLFTCSKDHSPTVWRSDTGERLGTYDGHTGAVYQVDVTRDSLLLLSASADPSVRLWQVETGRELYKWPHRGPVRSVVWAEGEREFVTCSDPFGMTVPAAISVFTFADEMSAQVDTPRLVIEDPEAPKRRITRVAWLPLNAAILAAYEDGSLRQFHPQTGELLGLWHEHAGAITSVTFNAEKTLLVTSSADRSSKLWDVEKMRVLRTYLADVPVNAAALAPNREILIMGGGQEARDVTTTSTSAGKFETRFHSLVFEAELGRVKGHFGPINTLAFHPDGRSFASGAEDGYIRLHALDAAEYAALGNEAELDDPRLEAALRDGTFESLLAEEAAARGRSDAAKAGPAAAMAPGGVAASA